jgi:pimeloyl-ACP methyl ester carboxylesterase
MLARGRAIAEKEGLFAAYRQAFDLSYSSEYCRTNRGRLAEVEALLGQADPEEAVRGYLGQSHACSTHDSRELAPRIKAPALVIVGAEDVITPPQASRELAAAIPRSELMILPRGGHGFWREFPEEVTAPVREFLARN